MIYLKNKRLLFLKPHKVAGTSLEIALSFNATPEDIVSPIDLKEEFLRIEKGAQLPVNWSKSKEIDAQYQAILLDAFTLNSSIDSLQLTNTSFSKLLPLVRNHLALFDQHIRPVNIIKLMGWETFSAAHKVTIHRHPYDQLVSHAYYDLSRYAIADFNTAVNNLLAGVSYNTDYYFRPGFFRRQKRLCDTYIRYERLISDLEKLEKKFDLEIVKHLPMAKSGIRVDKRDAREILTSEQKNKCFERNRLEFEFFGYEK